ncbi:hypothetical protein [Novosphingobium sp. Rr 2-17]|uniref:hypothetical protein n=1 Tax=Novosphingobium sp. Rr 2-17 TaxID=555793 RepID=UPI000317DB6C|nr:hypothetical protein [Novosphingobium sp. Rr 2-17]
MIIVTSREIPEIAGGSRTIFIFNMFRIADGKLVEHWDALPSAMTQPPAGGSGQR